MSMLWHPKKCSVCLSAKVNMPLTKIKESVLLEIVAMSKLSLGRKTMLQLLWIMQGVVEEECNGFMVKHESINCWGIGMQQQCLPPIKVFIEKGKHIRVRVFVEEGSMHKMSCIIVLSRRHPRKKYMEIEVLKESVQYGKAGTNEST